MEKKTLSPEQLAKMQEGRKKAFAARKLAKEQEKIAKKSAKAEAKKEHEEALRQQKAQAELIRKASEAKSRKKSDLSALKIKKETIEKTDHIEEEIEDISEEEEEELDIEPVETDDEKYKRVFEKESLKILNTLPNNAKNLFKKANSKFDCNLSVDENIKSMINYCKSIIKANVDTSNVVKKHVEEKTKTEIQPPVELVQKEREVEQKIYQIMKRFK